MGKAFIVPVINIGPLVGDGAPGPADGIIQRIGLACIDGGVFQIVNHGISRSLIEQVHGMQREFFAAPRSVKRAVMRTKDNARGYYDRELTKNTRDKKEVFDFGFKPVPSLPDNHRLNWTIDGYNQWPESIPEFKRIMTAYFDACQNLALKLTGALCLSLSLSHDRLHPYLVDSPTSFIRLNFYPLRDPVADEPDIAIIPLGEMGVHHHSDAGILTLLLQEDVAGLEVCIGGQWFRVDPVANALVVNLGDMMQVLSNDRFRSPVHRVLVSVDRERYSIPFFYNPAYSMDCYPLETLVDKDHPPLYTPINWGDFRKRRSDGDYADYGQEVQIANYRLS